MTPRLPGDLLYRVLAHCVSSMWLRDVIEPAIADLQYEAAQAEDAAARWGAILRGHLAVIRAVIVSGLEGGGVLRAALALTILSTAGTLLVTSALAARVDRRVVNSAILVPALLAPVLLRALGTTSPRRLFAGSLLAAMTTLGFAGGLGGEGGRPILVNLARVVAPLLVLGPLSAAAGIIAAPKFPSPQVRRVLVALAVSGVVATLTFGLARWPRGVTLRAGLAMAPFYTSLFGALFGVTVIPILLIVRRWVRHRWLIVIAAFVCSPGVVVAAGFIDGRTARECLETLLHAPATFTISSLPFVMGALALGWRLAGSHPPRSTSS
jgi:hypothetical protein